MTDYDVNGIDPTAYDTLAGFKAAVYDDAGVGSWLADAKLEVVWRLANDRDIPPHLQPLLADDAE